MNSSYIISVGKPIKNASWKNLTMNFSIDSKSYDAAQTQGLDILEEIYNAGISEMFVESEQEFLNAVRKKAVVSATYENTNPLLLLDDYSHSLNALIKVVLGDIGNANTIVVSPLAWTLMLTSSRDDDPDLQRYSGNDGVSGRSPGTFCGLNVVIDQYCGLSEKAHVLIGYVPKDSEDRDVAFLPDKFMIGRKDSIGDGWMAINVLFDSVSLI